MTTVKLINDNEENIKDIKDIVKDIINISLENVLYTREYDQTEFEIKYERLFPIYDNRKVLENLKIDKESIHFISTPNNAKKIANIIGLYIKKHFNDITIVDSTAGVGGDSIAFAKKFGNVISIEIDKTRYDNLKNNMEAYEFKNVYVINSNSIDIIPKISKIQNIDVIYIDPPWGGKDYRNNNNLRLKISNMKLENVILNYFNPTIMLSPPKMVALKLPKNYDIKYLFNKLNNDPIEPDKFKIHMHSLNKMSILVIEKN